MPKRCALGCSNKNSYHRFPHPERNPDRFKAWVHIAGGKLDTPADYELYRKKVICDIHFTERDRNRNNRLNFLAVPSLHLTGKSDELGTSEKVLLAPKPVNEEISLATLKLTLTDNRRAGIISSGHIYCPLLKTAIKEKQSMSDEVGTSEKVLIVPEPVNEESSIVTLKPTLTDNSCCDVMVALEEKLKTITEENTRLKDKITTLEQKLEVMEREKRKYKLVFFGIEEIGKSEAELTQGHNHRNRHTSK